MQNKTAARRWMPFVCFAFSLWMLLHGSLSTSLAQTSSPSSSNAVEDSVVRVFTTARYPDVYKPWMKQTPAEVTGSGVVIDGKRILTCAHVVEYASQVQIQPNQSSERLTAVVESIAPGIDLAVLRMEDEKFFDTHRALPRATTMPSIGDAVLAYGYPRGGDGLSITKGIVSRIEFAAYSPQASGMRIQIDAAINPGNSGGPAIANGKIIGLAFSLLGGAQNIGYIIPSEEIELFLRSINDSGHYTGKWMMLDWTQGLASPSLRGYLKLPESVTGVMVSKPERDDSDYPLKENDVITHIGGKSLDNEGMIQAGPDLRLQFKYMIQKLVQPDGKVPLTVYRPGGQKTIDIELPVLRARPQVIPELAGAYPSYFVYGPVVFTDATTTLVTGPRSTDTTQQPQAQSGAGRLFIALVGLGSPLSKRLVDKPAFEGERLVVISTTFTSKLTRGYHSPVFQVVRSVNGTPIKNLKHLVQVLRDSRDEYVVVKFDSHLAETLVFPRKQMRQATEDVLSDNSIRSQGSNDVMAIWDAKD